MLHFATSLWLSIKYHWQQMHFFWLDSVDVTLSPILRLAHDFVYHQQKYLKTAHKYILEIVFGAKIQKIWSIFLFLARKKILHNLRHAFICIEVKVSLMLDSSRPCRVYESNQRAEKYFYVVRSNTHCDQTRFPVYKSADFPSKSKQTAYLVTKSKQTTFF